MKTHIKNTRKYTLILSLLLLLCLLGTACSGGQSSEASVIDTKAAMNAALEAGTTLPDMMTVTEVDGDKAETALVAVTDIDPDKFSGYGVSYSTEGKADEIVILNVKDSSDIDDAANALTSHVASRKILFENYDAKEAKRYDDAVVFTLGNCAVLIVCDDSAEVKTAIEGVINAAIAGE